VAGTSDNPAAGTAHSDRRANLGQESRSTLGNRGASLETMRLAAVFNTMLERLHAAFQRQIRFTADASHELRTPVSVILSQAEHTLTRPRDAEHYSAALHTCLKAARRMKRVVDDLLLLARADSGKLEVRYETLDLAEVTRQTLALIAPLAEEKEVRLSSQLQTTPAIGDARQLGQVVTNLVTNAIQYNRPGGEVFVTVNTGRDGAQLMVADSGIGIPQDDLPHRCERFYRADAARTHLAGQGTGLGLSIVAEIVAAHSGTMNVTSEPGIGTTVTVQFSRVVKRDETNLSET
jgi:two-component system OmpR family sensor kinase